MLRKSAYLLILLAIIGLTSCTKSHVVEPSNSVTQRGGDSEDGTAGDGGLISDDDDDEGDSERDRTASD